VFDNQDQIAADTVVEVWKGGQWENEMKKITAKGYRAILSAPWYLNYISYGADWVKYYKVDPLGFSASESQKRLVMGGEVRNS